MTDVAENSIAAGQNIQREDVITEVDNQPVTNVASFRAALTKPTPRAASCSIWTEKEAARSRS